MIFYKLNFYPEKWKDKNGYSCLDYYWVRSVSPNLGYNFSQNPMV